MKVFKGFNEDQMKAIAVKLGFTGPIEKFDEFLSSSPDAASKFGLMSQKAMSIAKGKSFSTGGLVTKDKETPTVVPFSQASKDTTDTVNKSLTNPNANIVAGATPKTATIKESPSQIIAASTGKVDPSGVSAQTAVPDQQVQPNTATYQATTSQGQTEALTNQTQAAQGNVSNQGQIEAAQFDPQQLAQLGLTVPQISEEDKREATVQEQLKGLMTQFEGGQVPAWASGVLRSVNSQMAARGLNSSSMAAQAAVQAAMEAATAIAATDAQLIGQTNLANLDVRKQKMLSDAAAMSAMDMANLNNRQQAAVENAKAFLAMDFKNLDNRQQMEVMGFQARVNSILSDQAQENAAKQFNATSENQMNQFFSQLSASIDIQRAEMQNDANQFNASLFNQREQFNSQMALTIAQANTQWRQQISTTNTAAQNLSNQLAAANIARMNETAFNAMVQFERDEMNYVNEALTRAFMADESAKERETRVMIASLDRDAQKRLTEMGYKYQAGSSIGGALLGIGRDILGSVFKW